jgi:hypothetical protein
MAGGKSLDKDCNKNFDEDLLGIPVTINTFEVRDDCRGRCARKNGVAAAGSAG